MKHQEILQNRAERISDQVDETHCTSCDEPLVFAMRDKHHTFSLGLLTILECLTLAESKGYVPPLDAGWWIDVSNQYSKNFKSP